MIQTRITVQIKYCDCPDTGQDISYGKGFRVHILQPGRVWRCTVCDKRKVENEPIRS